MSAVPVVAGTSGGTGITPPVVRFVDVAWQHRQVQDEVEAVVQGILESGRYIQGDQVRAFEAEFAAFLGVQRVVGCANGTDALELCLNSLRLRPGGEVILPATTFAATAEAVVRVGCRPRFVDVDPETLLVDVSAVEAAITSQTVAVLPVHLYGACADVDALLELVDGTAVPVLEDAAQAHGAELRGRRAGSLGRAAGFSFYPGKNLGAAGEAGAVATSDAELADHIAIERDHGSVRKYEHSMVGRNSRMDEIQAAILRIKLRHLESWNKRRQELAARYCQMLADVPGLSVVGVSDSSSSVHHLFVVRVTRRDQVRRILEEDGIETGIHYPTPLHRETAFAAYHDGTPLPVAERAAGEILSLPMHPGLTFDDQDRVVASMASATRAAAVR